MYERLRELKEKEMEHNAVFSACAAAVSIADAELPKLIDSLGKRHYPGKKPGSKKVKRRNSICHWEEIYLADDPTYPVWKLRKRFPVFLRLSWALHETLYKEESRFAQRMVAAGARSRSSYQCSCLFAAIRQRLRLERDL